MTGAAGRPSFASFREALELAGFRPSRRLGQNFLVDENMCRALVRDAGVQPGDFVLEVGAGCGFLTAHLAAAGARVLAVEIDPRLREVAARFLEGRAEVELVLADALAGKHRLAPEVEARLPREGAWKLVANLPYVVSAPLLAVASELPNPPERVQVLVQKEVAERAAAAPGTDARGPLSVKLQASYRAELGRELAPALFWPRPKVQSQVLRLDRRPDAPGPKQSAALDQLTRTLFGHRRQAIGRALAERLASRALAEALLAEQGLDPLRRAETLSNAELLSLSESPRWAARA